MAPYIFQGRKRPQGRNYLLFAGGLFGEFALPNFIIPCEVIGVRFKQFSSLAGGGGEEGWAFIYPTSGVAASRRGVWGNAPPGKF